MENDKNTQINAQTVAASVADKPDAENITTLPDAADIVVDSVAGLVAARLYRAVVDYQKQLPDAEDVAMRVVQFNDAVTLLVDSIGYIGTNLIIFIGTDENDKPVELIQHVNQVNMLLMVVPKPPELPEKRAIGFVGKEITTNKTLPKPYSLL